MSEIMGRDEFVDAIQLIGSVGYSYTAGEYPETDRRVLAHDAALRERLAAAESRIAALEAESNEHD